MSIIREFYKEYLQIEELDWKVDYEATAKHTKNIGKFILSGNRLCIFLFFEMMDIVEDPFYTLHL